MRFVERAESASGLELFFSLREDTGTSPRRFPLGDTTCVSPRPNGLRAHDWPHSVRTKLIYFAMLSVPSASQTARAFQSGVPLARALFAFVLLLAMVAISGPAPTTAQDRLRPEPSRSHQAIDSLQPDGVPQPSGLRQVKGRRHLQEPSLRADSSDLLDVQPSTTGRAPAALDNSLRLRSPAASRRIASDRQVVLGLPQTQNQNRWKQRLRGHQPGRPGPVSVPPYLRRWDTFQSEIVSPRFISSSVAQGTFMHLIDKPGAWKRDTGGYLARVGSSAGSMLISTSVHHSMGAALDLRIRPPEPQGSLGARIRQAALQQITTRTASGRRVPAVARTTGTYVATLAQRRLHSGQWKPGRAVVSTVFSTGFSIVWATGVELVKSL